MATIKFSLSAKTDKTTGKSEILIRFFHGKIDQRAKSGLYAQNEYWDNATQRLNLPRFRLMTPEVEGIIKDGAIINTKLEGLKEHIGNSFLQAGAGKRPIPGTWLADCINNYLYPEENKPKSLLDLFQHYIEVTQVAPSRKRHFAVVWRAIKRFFIVKGITTNATLEDIDADMIRSFSDYLKKEHGYYKIEVDEKGHKKVVYSNTKFEKAIKEVPESRLPEPRGQNAINHFLNELRTFYLWAVTSGYTTNNPFDHYEIPASIYGTPYYITIEERNQLMNHDFSSSPRLETQRDIFVFQCVIGCRVSDLRNLTKDCLIDGAIEYIPRKTKEGHPVTVRVPLNSVARSILEKYQGIPGNQLLPCISDQKYNDAIKEVFKDAGITRMVTVLNPTTRTEEKRPLFEIASSHLARRCFIGNLYKQVKDPNLICKLSGHTEGSKAFARYRDIDEDMRKELVAMLEK